MYKNTQVNESQASPERLYEYFTWRSRWRPPGPYVFATAAIVLSMLASLNAGANVVLENSLKKEWAFWTMIYAYGLGVMAVLMLTSTVFTDWHRRVRAMRLAQLHRFGVSMYCRGGDKIRFAGCCKMALGEVFVSCRFHEVTMTADELAELGSILPRFSELYVAARRETET
jgi:hypothetical protein